MPTAIFDAYTDPKLVPKWMLGPEGWTMPVCEIDLRIDGTWHFVWRKTGSAEMKMHGEFRELSRPRRLVSTESWGPPCPDTVNTLVLTTDADQTLMTLTIACATRAARDTVLSAAIPSAGSRP